jgi:hypothetical protein
MLELEDFGNAIAIRRAVEESGFGADKDNHLNQNGKVKTVETFARVLTNVTEKKKRTNM